MNLTQTQADAIGLRGTNLLVAASAGSGKTEVLARRCVSLIADAQRPVGVEQLLVVTFTRAAAAELRVRIARMLRQAAAACAQPALRDHLRRQEVLVDAADIGTIDAWCGRVLRAHFADADVDPSFTMLAEEEAHLLRRKVLDDLMDDVHRGADALAQAAQVWIARAIQPDDGFLRRLILRLNRFREHVVDPQRWFAAQGMPPDGAGAAALLAEVLRKEIAFQRGQLTKVPVAPAEHAALESYAEALRAWDAALADPGRLIEVVEAIDAFKFPKGRGRPAPTPLVDEIAERWLKRRLQSLWSPDAVAGIVEHASAVGALVGTLLELEAEYEERLQAAKRRRAALEFGDVLRRTLDLLGTPADGPQRAPTPIALRLRQRYEAILVDEYQDTSPVQVEILRLVTREPPDLPNRFMVGDIKQSIYGFRQAEPRLFRELIDAFETGGVGGRVVYLSDNFRSHADLLNPLNRLFAMLFDRALGGTPYGENEQLRAGRQAGETANPTLDAGPRIRVDVLAQERGRRPARDPDGDEDGLEPERIEREAQLAADAIRRLSADGVQVPQRTGQGGGALRPLRLADIVILLRSAQQNAPRVARVLRDNGIACVTGGREALLSAVEVQDVRSVLTLLVNRRQDVPLAAYLRSPLMPRETGPLEPRELLAIRHACPWPHADFYDAVRHYSAAPAEGPAPRDVTSADAHGAERTDPRDKALAEKLAAALAQLDRWAELAREEDLPGLLRRILLDSALPHFVRGLPDGGQRGAMLRALVGFARQFAERDSGGVAEFVAYLDALAGEEIEPGALAAGEEDVVRILTIHAAKGLEFPVVFLLGAGTQFNRSSQGDPLQCGESLGLGLRFFDYPLRAELTSARHLLGRRQVAQRELEEDLRLLYVATTRARERLHIVGHAEPAAWSDASLRFPPGSPPPLVSRLSVQNPLEWVLMALAASGLTYSGAGPVGAVVTVRDAESVQPVGPPDPGRVPVPGGADVAGRSVPAAVTADDEVWVATGAQRVLAELPRRAALQPAVLSVSALKELARRARDADTPAQVRDTHAGLTTPAFAAAAGGGADPQTLGTAVHRFLEHAEPGALSNAAGVRDEVQRLCETGRLSAGDAALLPIDDLAWFGATQEAALLVRHAKNLEREVPFVWALRDEQTGEATIVRGVIDGLVRTPDGLVLIDYKTDRIADDVALAGRVETYSVQMWLYAAAAESLWHKQVVRRLLVFLRGRRIIDVPVPVRPLSSAWAFDV